jgi:hypothetical protein
MSFHVFFAFSTGLSRPITVPIGTLQKCIDHVEQVEEALGLERERYEDNPIHWNSRGRFKEVDNGELCQVVEDHNEWVRQFYFYLDKWAKEPVIGGEELTPDQATQFWHGLEILKVPTERWTGDYYRARMDELYEVMRGREAAGMSFGVKKLTEKQAAAVIRIFDQYLDPDDYRLDVPHGRDYLASSYDGGYDWCGVCGRAMVWEDTQWCKRRKCELREQFYD